MILGAPPVRNWLLAVPVIFTVSGKTVTPRRVDRAKDVSAAKWLQSSCNAPGYEGPMGRVAMRSQLHVLLTCPETPPNSRCGPRGCEGMAESVPVERRSSAWSNSGHSLPARRQLPRIDSTPSSSSTWRTAIRFPCRPKRPASFSRPLDGGPGCADDLSLHVYSPAFLLEERRDGSVVILRGLKREVLPKREPTDPPAIKPFSAKDIDPQTAGFVADFHDRPALVFAVQLAARGDEATAQDVWRQVATTKKWTSEYHRMRGLHTEERRARREGRNQKSGTDSRRVHFRRSRESTDAKGRQLADHLRSDAIARQRGARVEQGES